ncbi:hypothetical protein KGG72_gp57 [Streptomyces phage Salutena]|uniref:Uncharacterized protein n=1 Tax=Streptomyces phage Salutena TaxID=2767576 RepID=A0A7S6R863_9CAUD|nr:hypothetical protein KGG72_gp57 [Streptomyces phage Salutena]QOV06187.1 hypothetical protein CPT_Salutena_057 [Streptomyces phage Salutena]
MSETLKSLVERYSKAHKDREDAIGDFFDDEGELKAETNYARFDEARTTHWEESHGDLGSLLSELAANLGLDLTPGTRVLVKGGAETASGGEVYFGSEVTGEVLDGIDRDGDVKVKADNGIIQYVAPRFVKRLQD